MTVVWVVISIVTTFLFVIAMVVVLINPLDMHIINHGKKRVADAYAIAKFDSELEKIKRNIHPLQWELYMNEIIQEVGAGNKLSSADNKELIFFSEDNSTAIRLKAPISVLQSKEFEVRTYCGKCGTLDTHAIREPGRRQKFYGMTGEELPTPVAYLGMLEMRDGTYEDSWDVIRICNNCGHEWGQK